MGIDLAIGILLAIGAFRGYRRGFARPMVHLTGLILGILVAEPVSRWLLNLAGPRLGFLAEPIRLPAMFFASAFGIYAIFAIVGTRCLNWYRKRSNGANVPSRGDRVVGIGLGIAKAAFFICVLVFLTEKFSPPLLIESEIYQRQTKTSKGIQLASKYQPIGKLLQTEEAHQVREHLSDLLHFFRSGKDDEIETTGNGSTTRK